MQNNESQPLRIVIIGGVAGGASAAARARRVSAHAEIIILEKGPTISFANCGLPYHIGGEIPNRDSLLVATPELFWNRFRIQTRTHHEVLKIDRAQKVVHGMDHQRKTPFQLPYDRLILSMGSEPIRPPFWKEAKNLRHLWSLRDMDEILSLLPQAKQKKAIVVGGGFVGLETAEQLHHRGFEVSLIQKSDQILGTMDLPFARLAEKQLRAHGVQLYLSQSIESLEIEDGQVHHVILEHGERLETDLVIVGAGIRPRTQIAEEAGIVVGPAGLGIEVNEWMQTNDPDIYAVGDIARYRHGVDEKPTCVPLAGPANRSGRIAGNHAVGGPSDSMGEVYGTSIVRIFDWVVASTGFNAKSLAARSIDHRSVIIQAPNHASYFPGAVGMHLMLLYSPVDGKILGAQAIGGEGVDKRIDIVATAMHFGGTVRDLARLDLAYAPPFGSAKDPIHMAAFAACNDLDRSPTLMSVDAELEGFQIVDVRTAKERAVLPLPEAIGIPIDELADRLDELDPNVPTVVVCHSGKRAHVAACRLQSVGFRDVRNLTGGMSIRSLVT